MESNKAQPASDIDREIFLLVKQIAASPFITREYIRAELASRNLPQGAPQKWIKTLLRFGKDFKNRGQFGRLRAVVLIGVADIGSSFLSAAERSCLFLVRDDMRTKTETFLSRLAEEVSRDRNEHWDMLAVRLSTYRAFARLSRSVKLHQTAATAILSHRPRAILKPILAIANLAFLRAYMSVDLPDELHDRFESVGPPETVASIISALLALANSRAEIDSWDLAPPYVGDLNEPTLWSLIEHGQALFQIHEVGQYISLFGYTIEERGSVCGSVFYVKPPTRDFEYYLRLGYVRSEMHKGPSVRERENPPAMPMMALAELFVEHFGNRLCEVCDPHTPFRRVRLNFPIGTEFLKAVMESAFADDASEREYLTQEFMYPLRRSDGTATPPVALTAKLRLEVFMKIWRVVKFLSLVDIAAIRSYAAEHFSIFENSLVRIMRNDQMADLLAAVGFTPEELNEFWRLISANVNEFGFYDLQYRPFIRIALGPASKRNGQSPSETVHLPALVATTNVLRNVQTGNQIRFRDLPNAFVIAVAERFKDHFEHVTLNRDIRTEDGNSDVDIAIFSQNKLYLFECKHSVFPTGPHEMRDIVEDIEKGVKQVRLAISALKSPEAQRRYLSQWFPSLTLLEQPVSVFGAILCSQRVLSGIEWDGIPVRDYSCLCNLLGDGVLSLATLAGESSYTAIRFRIAGETGVTADSLDEFLSRNSRYFAAYAEFMKPFCSIAQMGDTRIVHETFLFDMTVQDWQDNMERIGAQRLPDEHYPIKIPGNWKDRLIVETPGQA